LFCLVVLVVGHCFNGNEFGNVFQYNLGASTLPVEKANLLSSVDSDHNPSTYWMPSPRNSLIGNVAAGSKGSGYWFEVEGFFRGASKNAPEVVDGSLPIPSRQDLSPYLFDSNKAHSNEGDGMQTYPSGGWKPPTEAIFSNFVSYRNRGAGSFSHNGLNQTFLGGYYADNQRHGIDIDRSYEGRIEDVTVVGYSAEMKHSFSHRPMKAVFKLYLRVATTTTFKEGSNSMLPKWVVRIWDIKSQI